MKKITVKYYWQGGAAGSEHDWNQPLNWYNRQVPGWFDEAVVSAEHTLENYHPIIEIFSNDIAQLIIEPGGRLEVAQTGRLSIDGLGKKDFGILNEGEILIFGELTVLRTTFANIRNKGLIYNYGSLGLDKKQRQGVLSGATGNLINEGELVFL